MNWRYIKARIRGIWFKYFPPRCPLHPEVILKDSNWVFNYCDKCEELQWLTGILDWIEETETNFEKVDFSYLIKKRDDLLLLLHLWTQNIDLDSHKIRAPKKSIFYEIPGTFNKKTGLFLVY